MRRIPKKSTTQQEVQQFNANQFVLENFLFEEQLKFVQDPFPFKVAVCSRRAGKTVACAAHLIHSAYMNPNTVSVYITMTGTSGKRIIWREFKRIVKEFDLKAKINDLDASLTFGNNSVVCIIGAKDETEIEKIRGIGIKLCYIDECQSFKGHIEYLIDDIIGPALMDNMGSLCLIGTPGPIPTGYFHKCWTQEEGWSKHAWTFWNNFKWPAVVQGHTHKEIFERELKRTGRSITDPSVRREFYGEWQTDKDSLLIKYDPDKNHFDELPSRTKYTYILGIDVGFEDADALAVLAWSDDSPKTYLVEEVVTAKQGITELVQVVQGLQKKYEIYKMVMDMGGLGKKIGEEMARRYQLPVEPADKTRKMENIELMNDALRTGRLQIKKDSRFAQDSYLVEIDKEKSTPDRIAVSNRFHSDIIDAVLYAFKCSPSYSYEPPPLAPPRWGTKEWADSQEDVMFEAELEGLKSEQENSIYEENLGFIVKK